MKGRLFVSGRHLGKGTGAAAEGTGRGRRKDDHSQHDKLQRGEALSHSACHPLFLIKKCRHSLGSGAVTRLKPLSPSCLSQRQHSLGLPLTVCLPSPRPPGQAAQTHPL